MPRLTTTALLALATLTATAAISSAQSSDQSSQPTSNYLQAQPAPIERSSAPDNPERSSAPDRPERSSAPNTQAEQQQPAQRQTAQPRLVDTRTTLAAGQSLVTTTNIASAQPTAGIWLRVGQNSSVRAIAVDPTHTEIRVEHGIANISVHQPERGAEILVDLPGGQTGLLKDGLYTFNADTNTIRVLKGEAEVYLTADTNAKPIKVKENHSVTFSGPAARSVEFAPLLARADLVPNVGGASTDGPQRGYGYSNYGYGPYGDGFYGGYPYYAGWGYPYGYGGFGYPYGYGFGFGGFYGGGFGYGGGFRRGYGGGFRGRR